MVKVGIEHRLATFKVDTVPLGQGGGQECRAGSLSL